jgi:hypothetical protein
VQKVKMPAGSTFAVVVVGEKARAGKTNLAG